MKVTIVDGIIIKNNKILLLKKLSKDYYETPGGKKEENETQEKCLVRELREEIGIRPTKFKKFTDLKLNFENKDITDHIFIIESFEGNPKITEKHIFEKLEWVDIEKMKKLNLAPNVKKLEKVI